jgi:N-acetylglucosamine kinase-like BadF-type ATPase
VAFFLGIDGGGTKTRCLLGDENSVVGSGSSSSCKVQRVGEACARDSLSAAIHEAFVQAGISPRQITCTCAGITGSGRLEIANVMRDLLSSIVSGEIEIIGDVEIAFEDAFGSGPGVIVIAGTGSIAYGRNADGKTARAGGWGHAISDEGSGYWIGVEAVKAALYEHDRPGNSDLLKSLIDAMGAEGFDDFIVRVNADPQPDYAALFPTVLAAADKGNSAATGVLNWAGIKLANLAETVLKRILADSQEISVATHGGVLVNSSQVRDSFARDLQARFPYAKVASHAIDPARGALNHARREFA